MKYLFYTCVHDVSSFSFVILSEAKFQLSFASSTPFVYELGLVFEQTYKIIIFLKDGVLQLLLFMI